MSYKTQAKLRSSQGLQSRIVACAITQPEMFEADQWVASRMLRFAAMPGWDGKWESAVAAAQPGEDLGDIGNMEAVITDGDILSAVQALVAKP